VEAFASPLRLIEIALVAALVESALLLAFARAGRGLSPRAVASLMVPGLCLLAAAWLVARDAPAAAVGACLAAAGLAHAADLAQRWRHRPNEPR
jgi:hypothetical protein